MNFHCKRPNFRCKLNKPVVNLPECNLLLVSSIRSVFHHPSVLASEGTLSPLAWLGVGGGASLALLGC